MDDEVRNHREAVKLARNEQANRDKVIRALLATAEGRDYVWWLLEIGKVGLQPFGGNALLTAFSCGELNVGQRILDHILGTDPDGYIQLLKARNDARRNPEPAAPDPDDESGGTGG